MTEERALWRVEGVVKAARHINEEDWPAGEGVSPDVRLGSWTDDDGILHVDITRHFIDRGQALFGARARRQRAIWNWNINREEYI
jgi:hypothetical protein